MYHSLFILMAIFPVGPGLVGTGMTPVWTLLELRMMDKVVTSEPTSCAKLQSNRHHQQTNTQLFTVGMPFLSPNQQCQSTEGKLSSNKIQNGDIPLPANPGPTGVFPTDIIRGLYDIRPGNGAGQFLQPRSPHGADIIRGLALTNSAVQYRLR